MGKEERLVKKLSPTFEPRTAIATEIFMPNHSGDHSAGQYRKTPIKDIDLVNKKYVDDAVSGIVLEETDPLSVHLDQSNPQTIDNGMPRFDDGIRVDKIRTTAGDYYDVDDFDIANGIWFMPGYGYNIQLVSNLPTPEDSVPLKASILTHGLSNTDVYVSGSTEPSINGAYFKAPDLYAGQDYWINPDSGYYIWFHEEEPIDYFYITQTLGVIGDDYFKLGNFPPMEGSPADGTGYGTYSGETLLIEKPFLLDNTGHFYARDFGAINLNGNLTIADGKDIILATTTGTKIGTGTNQKLGFWNATPIVRPTTSGGSATTGGSGGTTVTTNTTFDGYTLAKVVKALRNSGILT